MRQRRLQMWVVVLCTLLLGALAPPRAAAQGVTTAAIAGRVTNEQGQGVSGAQVVVTNRSNGRVTGVITREDGRYRLQGLLPGGPYRVEVRMVGYAPSARDDVVLALSQTASFDFTIAQQAVALQGLSVTAERNSVLSSGRTGTTAVVDDSAVSRLPTITRDFTDFTRLTPQISTSGEGSNVGGRNSRFNIIQIDGAANNDLFGLNPAATPGSGADQKPITLEAIQEFQVAIAPFDVRQGGFTGAAINAVTKPGTNDLKGTLSYYNRNEGLVGRFKYPDTGDRAAKYGDFAHEELGFSLGGPIVKDRLHFFFAGELTRRSAPINNVAGTATSQITLEELQPIADTLRLKYGYEPGELGALNLDTEGNNFFGRLDWSINPQHRLTVRHNYVDGFRDDLDRSNSLYRFGGSLFQRDNRNTSTVGQLNSNFGGGLFNELRLGYSIVRDKRLPSDNTPSVRINLDGTRAVFAGSEQFSGQNVLDQDVFELTDDFTFAAGRHNITLGTHNEFFSFSNLFVRNAFGYYEFSSPASFYSGTPSRFEYTYLLDGGRERADFDVRQFGFYAQDQVDLTDNLTLTAGLRYDVTTFPENPGRNPQFETVFKTDSATVGGAANAFFGRRTDQIPSGNGAFSPRLGFNWDVLGDRSLQLRGGVGLFSGRTPYVWLSNAYGNTGLDYVRFTCDGRNGALPPAYVSDPANQPKNCAGSTRLAANEINLADPDFEMPQVLRTSLALDRDLPLGFVGTFEGVYSKSRNDVLYRNLNLGPASGTVEGRPRYTGKRTSEFDNVVDITNTNEGYNYSLTFQVQRPFRDSWDVSAAYTFTRAEDVNSTTSSQAFSNWRYNPIDADPNNPSLRPTNFEVPHRVVVSGSYQLSWMRRAPLDVSFIYTGESGRPYSYTYNGDVNNDGSNGNDLLYVPSSASEIVFEPFRAPNPAKPGDKGQPITPEQSWENLNSFIESVECLRENRGTVVERNACRQPWRNRMDLRLAQTLPTLRGHSLQLIANVINFGNLLNSEWGLDEYVPNQNDALLSPSSTSTVLEGGRLQMRAFGPGKRQFNTSNLNSRYQVQLGVRYSF